MWCFLDRFIVTFGVIIHVYIYIYASITAYITVVYARIPIWGAVL